MLQFILGNSGAGKSHYLYEKIIQESMKHPEINYLVIVPEQFTMQTQQDLCNMHPNHGIMNIDVLSFGRMAHRIFEEVGQSRGQVLDDEGKNLILRKIAGQYEDRLKVLKGNLKKQGYISEVKSVISEFTQYGVGFEELDVLMENLDEESFLYYKLSDIRLVYEGFEQFLAEKYITKEELLDVLSQMAAKSEILKNSVIALDGFTGFTPVQNRLLGELMSICKEVLITVEMDGREDAFRYTHPYQLFALSKQMVTSLVQIAGERKIEIAEPICLYDKPVYRFRSNPELGFLESELFRYSRKQYPGETDHISVYAAGSPDMEAKLTAQKIRRLVREKGYHYRDVAVICSDMGTYADHLERACTEYQIPVFMDYKKSILLNAFVEYVRSVLSMVEQDFSYESVFRFLRTGFTQFTRDEIDRLEKNAFVEYVRSVLSMVEQDFSYESVFRFLRTGFTQFTRDEIDRLENYVVAVGLRGYKKWQAVWARKTDRTDEEELAVLNGLRVRFVEMTEPLVFVLKHRKKTVGDICEAVYRFFVENQIQEKLKVMENCFAEKKELALAKEYAQIYRIVLELFDKFAELLGDEGISLKEYCELLDAGLEEAKVGVIPPGMDQVVIGDVQRTRLKSNLKALFFVGANDTLLPGNMGQGGLLTERDREWFQKEKQALSPGAKEKTYIQKFYLYMNLTKPKEFLYISYSKVSSDGKTLRPAYLIWNIASGISDLGFEKAVSETCHYRRRGASHDTEGADSGRRAGICDPRSSRPVSGGG